MKLFAAFVLLGLATSGIAQDLTILGTLADMGETRIIELVEMAGLTDALEGPGPFTAFVPKQSVFESLPQEITDAIESDMELLTNLLTYHVVSGLYMSSDAVNDILLPTLQGMDLRGNIYDDVDGETVVTVAGVPIDMTMVDIEASNGVIHFLDFVILNVPVGDTVETISAISGSDMSFEALLYAAESLDLVGAIVAGTDITVLAPVDSDGWNTDVVDELLGDPEAFTTILQTHLAQAVVFSAGIGSAHQYETFAGNTIEIAYVDDVRGYVVRDLDGNELADVIAGDIPTTQGVLHIVDQPIIVA